MITKHVAILIRLFVFKLTTNAGGSGMYQKITGEGKKNKLNDSHDCRTEFKTIMMMIIIV